MQGAWEEARASYCGLHARLLEIQITWTNQVKFDFHDVSRI